MKLVHNFWGFNQVGDGLENFDCKLPVAKIFHFMNIIDDRFNNILCFNRKCLL